MRRLPHVKWTNVSVSINGKRALTLRRAQFGSPVRLAGLPGRGFVLVLTAKASNFQSETITREYHACAAAPKAPPTTGTTNPSPTPTPTPAPAPTTAPSPGSYSGGNSQGGGLGFYVSSDSKQVQDITIGRVDLSCSNGTSQSDYNFGLADAAIAADGSFTGSLTENAIKGGVPATIIYSFSGRFHGVSSSGQSEAAGQLREDVSYAGGSSYTCTSNDVSWSATRNAQGSQAAAPPAPGSYSGGNSQGGGLDFFVSSDSKQVQDLSIGRVDLSCSNGTSQSDYNFGLADAAIAADGSFTGSLTQNAVKGGVAATITYTLSGHFHGLDTSGRTRAAGQLREDITYPSGTSYTCTSNNVSWSATS